MCSIEGTTNTDFDISQFTEINKNRGPDGTNFFKDEEVNFGHNLLAISPNPTNKIQPYVSKKGNVLLYNGEIYGLDKDTFDVEWLADRLDNEGVMSLADGVNGMWAFAWYEPHKKMITLCRDHFGQKPLYYTEFNDNLYFSSTTATLNSLIYQENVNPSHIGNIEEMPFMGSNLRKGTNKNFLDNLNINDGFNSGPWTLGNGIYKLTPGQVLTFHVDNKKWGPVRTLWSTFKIKANFLWNKWELEEILTKYIRDVGTARGIKKTISLSGGLDSSLIAAICKDNDNISVSSVHWEDKNIKSNDPSRHMMDEIQLSKETSKWLGLDHYVTEIPHDNELYHEEVYTSMYGVPSWDIQRLLPRFYNITQAAKNGNKIYMTGDCADELLTGYNGDFFYHEKGPLTIEDLKRKIYADDDYDRRHESDKGTPRYWWWKDIRMTIPRNVWGDDNINNHLFYRLLTHCDGFATVVDHMCGYYGMESRMPFLHQSLVKYLINIPGAQKLFIPFEDVPHSTYKKKKEYLWFMMGHYKGILRTYMKKYYTKNVLNKKKKTGFSNPWNARDGDRNSKMRLHQYKWQKQFVQKELVDYKDVFLYNLIHDIKSENVNE